MFQFTDACLDYLGLVLRPRRRADKMSLSEGMPQMTRDSLPELVARVTATFCDDYNGATYSTEEFLAAVVFFSFPGEGN